ncbi:hypothetical protein [Streptomyces sp. 142MFCol3.1]|nr:hypothetical protein [Streptomyces sp. 142MFCol3.1]
MSVMTTALRDSLKTLRLSGLLETSTPVSPRPRKANSDTSTSSRPSART